MIRKYLKHVLNFSAGGMPTSRWFRVWLRMGVAVTFFSCLLIFTSAGIYRADSKSSSATIGNNSMSKKQSIPGDGTNAEVEPSFPPEPVTMPEKLRVRFKELVQENSLIPILKKGGPIMWPLLLASILALGTVIERVIFLIGEQRNRNPQEMENFLAAVGQDDIQRAIQISNESKFYLVRMLGYVLTHSKKSLASALLYAQEQELKRFRRGIPILDTVITLAPLLGLLGTVTGMMGSFSLIGGELSTPGAITGGIAEALIATAFGLGIAITALIPFNILNNQMEKARLEIESAATQLKLLMHPRAGTVTTVAQASHPGQIVRFRRRLPISFPKG